MLFIYFLEDHIIKGPPVRTYRTNSGAYRKARVYYHKNQGRASKSSRQDPIQQGDQSTGESPQIQPPILVSQSDQASPTKIDDNNNNNTEKVSSYSVFSLRFRFVKGPLRQMLLLRIKFGADC